MCRFLRLVVMFEQTGGAHARGVLLFREGEMYDQEWVMAEKKVDPDFEGSLLQQLGFDPELCPTCEAHLHGGICLNTCHLTKESRVKFAALMSLFSK